MPFKVQGHAHHRASTNPGRSHLAIRVAAIGIKFLLARAPPPSGSPESSVPPGCQAMHIGTAHLNLGRSHIAHLGAVERQLQSQGPFIFFYSQRLSQALELQSGHKEHELASAIPALQALSVFNGVNLSLQSFPRGKLPLH
jgi:hypothetical protein